MTRVLAVANQKGGVGKTTTVVNLAAALAAAGRRVLVVDLDPQASATRWLGGSVDDAGSGEALTGGTPLAGLARPVLDGHLHLVPASLRLAAAERSVGLAPGSDERLRRSLAELPPGWGYVVLDCPPNLGLATLNALNAATDVIVPVEAQVLPLHGLVGMLRTLDGLPRRPGAASRPARILACRFDARTRHAREVLAELRARFDGTLFRTVIRQNVRLAECPSFHLPVHLYAPRCRGDRDYRDLADEVLAAETTRDD